VPSRGASVRVVGESDYARVRKTCRIPDLLNSSWELGRTCPIIHERRARSVARAIDARLAPETAAHPLTR
jgi:hypothetical protein